MDGSHHDKSKAQNLNCYSRGSELYISYYIGEYIRLPTLKNPLLDMKRATDSKHNRLYTVALQSNTFQI